MADQFGDCREPLDSGDAIIDRVASAFCRHVRLWQPFGIDASHILTGFANDVLTLGVDITDPIQGVAVRTLRADYAGTRLLVGPDETGQFVTALVEGRAGVRSYAVSEGNPEAVGLLIAELLQREVVRPVVREEWDHPAFSRYVLADSGEELCWSSPTNTRPGILGPPTRTLVVRGPFRDAAG